MRSIKRILKISKPRASLLGAFCFLSGIASSEENGGRGDYTRIFIASTRRSTQFSLGKAKLIRPAILASGFLKFFAAIAPRKQLYFRAV